MLDKQNLVVESLESPTGNRGITEQTVHEVYVKMVDYLRLTQSKNTYNRFSDYHYLNIPVSNSTEPVRGIDYIHPVVTPGIDYATAIITKCLMPNGKVNFEFERFTENDSDQARQATEMVKYMINSKNDSYQIIRDWAQDALLHKNGIVMLSPVREPITQYKEVEGTKDQLRTFETLAGEKGLTAKRQNMRKIDVDLHGAMQEMMSPDEQESQQMVEQEDQSDEVSEAIRKNTIYRAKYKLTGYSTNIKIKHVAQHYFVCNPTISTIQDQDFVGFYDPMTIHECKAQFPFVDLEKLADHAAYGPAGAYQAGALENDLALHARDSTPVPGQGVIASQGADRYSRVIMLTTAWIRKDVDGDGEEEIIEACFSGSYILYVKEVDFIPLANMCPKPIVGNFFGYSLGERLVPMQEYATAIRRAEMAFAMQSSTPRIGVNPEFLDAEEIQRGVSAMFILDRKFDPNKHIFEFQPMQGNLAYVQSSMDRFDADKMAMIGMTSPGDVLNPEVMKDGNSGYKLQLAMGPNQLIQDEMVKNCAIGLREVIYIMWKTLVQYSDDYNIQQLANTCLQGQPFLDAKSVENFEFIDRKMINIDLALGFMSDENRLTRQQMIIQAQQGFAQSMMQIDPSVPELFVKVRRPFEDTLRVLGVKDVDAYLPTMEEATKMATAKSQKPPSPEEQELKSKTDLNNARTGETQAKAGLIAAQTKDIAIDDQFTAMAARAGKLKAVELD
jgi:uncharacterized membrane protein